MTELTDEQRMLLGTCTESYCSLCWKPGYARKLGMTHAGIPAPLGKGKVRIDMDELMSLEEINDYDQHPHKRSLHDYYRLLHNARSAPELRAENEKLREELRVARAEERARCANLIHELGTKKFVINRELIGFHECEDIIRALGDAE